MLLNKKSLFIPLVLLICSCNTGYQHPEWGHGFWKGEEAVGYEVWDLNEINPEDYSFFHIHQIIKATMNDLEGYGTLENLVVGRHDPSGFKDLFDVTE